MIKKDITTLVKKFFCCFMPALLSFNGAACNARQEPTNYHEVNQPVCHTDDFFDSDAFHVNNDKIAFIYNAAFYKGRRMACWNMSFEERLIRSLKGNIKSIVMERHITTEKEYELHIYFDKDGKVTKIADGYHNSALREETNTYHKYSNFTPGTIEEDRKDSARVRDKDDFFSYTFYKGKPYMMYHLMGDVLEKYSYHSNGNRAIRINLGSHEKWYFNNDGLLDSIADANSADKPTELGKTYYAYKGGLVAGYSEYEIKLGKNKNDTSRTRVQTVQYLPGTDLIQRINEVSTYDDAKTTNESEIFEYNTKQELVRLIKNFNGPFTDYSFVYEYDEAGNWIKVTQLKEGDKDEPFTYLYKISYQYY